MGRDDNTQPSPMSESSSPRPVFVFLTGAVAGVVTGLGLLATYGLYVTQSKPKGRERASCGNDHNTVAICQSTSESIDIRTHLRFVRDFGRVDRTKDVNIVIETTGGDLSSAEAIAECLLRHRGPGKLRCYIPRYAYSSGLLIALCCDEIIMGDSAIVGPIDGQLLCRGPEGVGMRMCPMSAVVDGIRYKRERDQDIREEWLVLEATARKGIARQTEFLRRICRERKYDDKIQDTLRDNLISGKYMHDQTFTADDLAEWGLRVKIADPLPEFVEEFLPEPEI